VSRCQRGRTDADGAARGQGTSSEAVVVIPVKAFSQAKMRLSPVLSPSERATLARTMAEHVIKVARPLPVVVVCDDREVAQWARNVGARALVEPGAGLNGAVGIAFAELGREGYKRIIVAHGDLPLATNLAWLAEVDGVVLVPDRHEEGTNVLSLPAGSDFRFSYGTGSFARHCAEAERLGLAWLVVRDAELGWDVDFPIDLVAL